MLSVSHIVLIQMRGAPGAVRTFSSCAAPSSESMHTSYIDALRGSSASHSGRIFAAYSCFFQQNWTTGMYRSSPDSTFFQYSLKRLFASAGPCVDFTSTSFIAPTFSTTLRISYGCAVNLSMLTRILPFVSASASSSVRMS